MQQKHHLLLLAFWLSGVYFSEISVAKDSLNQEELQRIKQEQGQLKKLALDDLFDIKVTSVSRKEQKISESAAAVYVITQEDIKRTGATSIPEVLRMAPGIDVARIDANKWAVTSRGFNGSFANKLLVLIDGRSVYSPLFSGVYWDVQDTVLEDIERIEIIRGSGASLWGSNAVNGIINIITKHSKETQGGLLSGGVGTEDKIFGSFRYGGQINEDINYRIYAKYFERDDTPDFFEQPVNDDWDMFRGGFRVDWQVDAKNEFTFQGEIYDGNAGTDATVVSLTPPFSEKITQNSELGGGHLLSHWRHKEEDGEEFNVRLYYDHIERNSYDAKQQLDTLSFDFQQHFHLLPKNQINWGLGYRFISDSYHNGAVTFWENHRSWHLFTGFIQDEISLIDKELKLILGSKFSHNDYSGFEIQPNIRLLWMPNKQHTLWGAVSRAVRTPMRLEDGAETRIGIAPTSPVTPITLSGQAGFDSEEMIAFESGYRYSPVRNFTVDIVAFYNLYDKLRDFEQDSQNLFKILAVNNMEGESYGIEVSSNWQVTENWRLKANYSFLQIQLHPKETMIPGLSEENIEGKSPHHKFSILSNLDITPSVTWDLWLRYTDKLPALNIPAYFTMDTQLSWKPLPQLELSVIGQNLLDGQHPEFTPEFLQTTPTQVERAVYGKITWKF